MKPRLVASRNNSTIWERVLDFILDDSSPVERFLGFGVGLVVLALVLLVMARWPWH